jgi:hypothetical protein
LSFDALAAALFPMPGCADAQSDSVLARAGAVHSQLLAAAVADNASLRELIGEPLAALLKGPATAEAKRRWLDAPQFIEALHLLARTCPALRQWDRTITDGDDAPSMAAFAHARFGNVALPLRLMMDRQWCGRIDVASNGYGQITFPCSPWSIVLRAVCGGQVDLLADTIVDIVADQTECHFYVASDRALPILTLRRNDFLSLLVGGRDPDVLDIQFRHPTIRPQIKRTPCLGTSGIHLEAVAVGDESATDATSSIIAALVRAIARNAASIYAELCMYIHTVRVFNLAGTSTGVVQSFSMPVEPGVIGFNVAYSPSGEPYLSPLCFTWLAHELAHTKHYLIDDIAFGLKLRFLDNPGEWTAPVARYGRALRVATVFQIPYVHLYERALLMDFAERRFGGLPWQVDDAWREAGEEMAEEIEASFDLMHDYARLTLAGSHVVDHLRRLVHVDAARWRQVSERRAT